MPQALDHGVVIAFTLLLPALALHRYPRLKRRLDAGVPGARARQYRRTMATQWVLGLGAAAVWFHLGRAAGPLGLAAPTGRTIAGAGLVAALLLFWKRQIERAVSDDESRGRVLEQLRTLSPILPSTRGELRLFVALSVTAGICEELLFRGYLIWYLDAYLGELPAILLSSVVFGVAHSYQGGRFAMRIVFVGLVLAGLYRFTGSLWVPMLAHAAADAMQGRFAHRMLRQDEERGAAPWPPLA